MGTLLRKGSSGRFVLDLQTGLNAAMPWLPLLSVDGKFGPATEARVRSFQAMMQIKVDGIVGPQTSKSLLAALIIKGAGRIDMLMSRL